MYDGLIANNIGSLLLAFSDLINPSKALISGLIAAKVFFIIAIALVIIFRKQIRVKRKYLALKILSYAYLFIIPILMSITAFTWFGINSMEKQVVKNLPSFIKDNDLAIQSNINSLALQAFDEKELDRTLGEIIDEYEDKSKKLYTDQVIKMDWKNGNKIDAIVSYLFICRPGLFRKAIIEHLNKHLGDKVLSKDVVEKLMNEKLINLIDSSLITKVIEYQSVKILSGFKKKVLIIFIIFMLIPLAEIIWSNLEAKKSIVK